jgi:hypothetical protein
MSFEESEFLIFTSFYSLEPFLVDLHVFAPIIADIFCKIHRVPGVVA